MKLLTTIQVRDIMHRNGGHPAYTNKTKGHTGNVRRIKAYFRGNTKMLAALRAACGAENVNLTPGVDYVRGSGQQAVTVRCTLE